MSAVQVCTFTVMALVPTIVLILRFCFSALKRSTIGYRSLSIAAIVVAARLKLSFSSTASRSWTLSNITTRRSFRGSLRLYPLPGRWMTSSRRM